MGAGRFSWSIYPRATSRGYAKPNFVVRYTLSSIVIRCFNHCLQTTLIMFCECNCFSGNEQFIARNISSSRHWRAGLTNPCLRRVSRIWLYGIALLRTEQINLGVDELQRRQAVAITRPALRVAPSTRYAVCRVTCVDHVAPREGADTRDGEWFFRSRKVSTFVVFRCGLTVQRLGPGRPAVGEHTGSLLERAAVREGGYS